MPACINKCLRVSAGFDTKFENCPGQHSTSLESTQREGKGARMIGTRVFTVNKNKDWQAGWLLHRNAPCSHLHSFFVCVWLWRALSAPGTPTQRPIVTLTYSMFGSLFARSPTLTRLTTTVCGGMLNTHCVWLIGGEISAYGEVLEHISTAVFGHGKRPEPNF